MFGCTTRSINEYSKNATEYVKKCLGNPERARFEGLSKLDHASIEAYHEFGGGQGRRSQHQRFLQAVGITLGQVTDVMTETYRKVADANAEAKGRPRFFLSVRGITLQLTTASLS